MMREKILRHIIFIISLALTICVSAIQAQDKVTTNSDKFIRLYEEANKNVDNAKGAAIADTLISMARAEGNATKGIMALFVKLKYECTKNDNLAAVDREARSIMTLAQKSNLTEYFYSAVSHKVTYLTNHGLYDKALSYQYDMMKYAKEHNHSYGIILCHISLGNLYRMRLDMPQAIDEYKQVLESYKKYNINNDLGRDYKRIVECYLIIGEFKQALEYANLGLKKTHSPQSESGLNAYKAFCTFMLRDKANFRESYAKYKSFGSVRPDVIPFVAKCVETMKLIDDGKLTEARQKLQEPGMGAFKSYVEMAYNGALGNYPKVLATMNKLHISLFGNNHGTFTTDWARMSEAINNNLNEMDKQKASYKNSMLALKSTRLELKNNELELMRYKDAERLAWLSSESKSLSYKNRKLLSRQLRDSLMAQKLLHEENEQRIKSNKVTIITHLAIILVLFLLAYMYLRHNKRISASLKETNANLKDSLDELKVANDKAQESDRMKTQFIQDMSHEVRTPLNAVVGFSQMLASGEIDKEDKAQVEEIINDNSEILNTIITNILDITSLESGRYTMKKDKIKINDMCRETLEKMSKRKHNEVEMLFRSEIADDYSIESDKDKVAQVITNLLSNAMKNTEEGRITLECTLRGKPGMITFSVSDTGVGVPKDKMDDIFQRFCKLDKFKQGTGLGLNICLEIAKKLNGKIDIDRNYTGGARFWFAIPTANSK